MSSRAAGNGIVRLPRLMVIADRFTVASNTERILELAESGVLPWVQLRDHDVSFETFEAEARRMVERVRVISPETRISLNGHPGLATSLGAGVHLGFRSARPAEVSAMKPRNVCIGYSAHANEDLAVIAPCDYITFSPVFPVQKPTASVPMGIDGIASMADRWAGPIYALGGIRPESTLSCLAAGAYGISVFSGIMGASDPVSAAKRYVEIIEEWTASNG